MAGFMVKEAFPHPPLNVLDIPQQGFLSALHLLVRDPAVGSALVGDPGCVALGWGSVLRAQGVAEQAGRDQGRSVAGLTGKPGELR